MNGIRVKLVDNIKKGTAIATDEIGRQLVKLGKSLSRHSRKMANIPPSPPPPRPTEEELSEDEFRKSGN